ncbi:hypothetical protein SPB21_28260 [Leptothoe sp. ISB3NOV94-8A]|uniref:Uncharacterized protein n=1 Tax=Adonisia turfae CCMR0081 TaxID=2292702 RepID=A0A6M0RTJ1_9CYAN|nr:hypothetical protein [Adonisia turfae]NEZ59584.1 hypothetical protein [Adonisia turfae CCMR0081]
MKTIRLRSHVNESGLLQVQLPDHHNEEVEILIVYQPVQATQKRQWSQKFLDLFGAWQGEPLVRAPQGNQPEREPLL